MFILFVFIMTSVLGTIEVVNKASVMIQHREEAIKAFNAAHNK